MSRIDDLIKQYAPDGVPRRALSDVGTFIRGRRFVKDDMVKSGVPAIHYGEIYTHYGTSATRAISHVREEIVGTLRFAEPGDVVIAGVGETVEDVAKAVAWLGTTRVAIHDDSFAFRSSEDPAYIAYIMQTADFHAQKEKYVARGKVKRVGGKNLGNIVVPMPPLEIQREIVRVLDAFTELEDELEAERRLRREQRTAVINNEFIALAQTERVPLGELATQFVEPLRVEPDQEYINLGVKWYGEGAFAREAKFGREIKGKTLYKVRSGQFIYNRMFVTEGSFGVVTPDIAHGVVSNEFPVFELDASRILPEWLYLKFRDPYIVSVVAGQASGGTKSRRRWREDQFRAFSIDLPSLEDQREMVRVHNQFLGLESAITAELEGRRHQFAYYRDRLLSFEEAA